MQPSTAVQPLPSIGDDTKMGIAENQLETSWGATAWRSQGALWRLSWADQAPEIQGFITVGNWGLGFECRDSELEAVEVLVSVLGT